MQTIKKTSRRENGNLWCSVTVELRETDKGPELSITGETGSILTPAKARQTALDYWASFFEENPAERKRMAQKFGKTFRTDHGAARFVVETDGEFHGLDVAAQDSGKVYVLESCGQIRDEIAKWFPEVVPYLQHHLNNMKAECEHQEARGETWKTHACEVCPQCGYRLGSAWLRRELPPIVLAWARTFGDEVSS